MLYVRHKIENKVTSSLNCKMFFICLDFNGYCDENFVLHCIFSMDLCMQSVRLNNVPKNISCPILRSNTSVSSQCLIL